MSTAFYRLCYFMHHFNLPTTKYISGIKVNIIVSPHPPTPCLDKQVVCKVTADLKNHIPNSKSLSSVLDVALLGRARCAPRFYLLNNTKGHMDTFID